MGGMPDLIPFLLNFLTPFRFSDTGHQNRWHMPEETH